MLVLDVVIAESYDETTERFVKGETVRLELEHSLVSLSKWEATHEKPFLSHAKRTDEETISYVKAMIIGDEPTPEVFYKLLVDHLDTIMAYVSASNSGTHFTVRQENPGRRETITAETIYYWMAEFNADMSMQHWHLNRLFAYLRLHALKKTPAKKMSMAERRALNEQRRREWNTTG